MRMGIIVNDGEALEAWIKKIFIRWEFANKSYEDAMPIEYKYVLIRLAMIKSLPSKKAIPLFLMLLGFQIPEVESLHSLAGNVARNIMPLFYTDFFNKNIATKFFLVVAEWMEKNILPISFSSVQKFEESKIAQNLGAHHYEIVMQLSKLQDLVLKARSRVDQFKLLCYMLDTTKKGLLIQNFDNLKWQLASYIFEIGRFNDEEKKEIVNLLAQFAKNKCSSCYNESLQAPTTPSL